jgi:hypothetical protein
VTKSRRPQQTRRSERHGDDGGRDRSTHLTLLDTGLEDGRWALPASYVFQQGSGRIWYASRQEGPLDERRKSEERTNDVSMTNTLNYRGQNWEGIREQEDECFKVSMADATFQRHLTVYLESRGMSTLTYLELLEYVDKVLEQRVQAAKQLQQLDYWRDCDDPEVRIIPFRSGQKK